MPTLESKGSEKQTTANNVFNHLSVFLPAGGGKQLHNDEVSTINQVRHEKDIHDSGIEREGGGRKSKASRGWSLATPR